MPQYRLFLAQLRTTGWLRASARLAQLIVVSFSTALYAVTIKPSTANVAGFMTVTAVASFCYIGIPARQIVNMSTNELLLATRQWNNEIKAITVGDTVIRDAMSNDGWNFATVYRLSLAAAKDLDPAHARKFLAFQQDIAREGSALLNDIEERSVPVAANGAIRYGLCTTAETTMAQLDELTNLMWCALTSAKETQAHTIKTPVVAFAA